MSDQVNIFGKKVNGELKITNREVLNKWIESIPEGSDVVIKFKNQKSYKTNRQVRLCYVCLRKLSKVTGHSVSDMKLLMKLNQGLCWTHNIQGTEITECKSISEMTKEEISDFIINMDLWATNTLNHPLLTHDDLQFLKS